MRFSLYWIFPLLIAILFFNSSIHSYVKYSQKIKKSYSDSTNISKQKLDKFGLNYQAINQTTIIDKKQIVAGKNLVFIYLESLEKIYQDQTVFEGLTPNINNYNKQGLVFNQIQQYKGTGWTMDSVQN